MREYRQKPDSFIICDNGLFEGIDHTINDLLEKIRWIGLYLMRGMIL
jgi:hypothetical protein